MHKLSSAAGFVGISDNTIDFNDLTYYTKYFISTDNTSPNKPFYDWCYLFSEAPYSYRKLQIAISDMNKDIRIRTYTNTNGWYDWTRLYPDYSNILLTFPGYIIFNNGLILQWGSSSVPYANFSIKNIHNINSGYISVTFPIKFTNRCLYVGNNRTYIHTNSGWEGGGTAAHTCLMNGFMSYAWIPTNIAFIENENTDGVGATYLTIGY